MPTARYWWHMLKTLSELKDPYHSAQADRFQNNKQWSATTRFTLADAVTPGLGEWMGRDYIEFLARFSPRSAQETYLRIAAGQGQSNVKYMAEKHAPTSFPGWSGSSIPGRKRFFWFAIFEMSSVSTLAYNRFARCASGPSTFHPMTTSRGFCARAPSGLSVAPGQTDKIAPT